MNGFDSPAGSPHPGPGRPPDEVPTDQLLAPVAAPESTPAPGLLDPDLAFVGGPDTRFPRVGERLLHFELVEELGRGAFARVYLARQESLAHRLVVLKVTADPTDEPQKLARLQHSNIVPVYSVHRAGPFQAVCMPYLGRLTLARVIAHLTARSDRRPGSGGDLLAGLLELDPAPGPPAAPPATAPGTEPLGLLGRMSFVEACVWLVAQVAGGLAHAHRRGILHRDLKPANILITDDGVPMILDFNVSSESPRLAADGRVGGTLPYMAPEHVLAFMGAANEVVGERSDLFALGVILYELLTGHVLFPNRTSPRTPEELAAALAARRAVPPPPSRHNPAVSPAVDAVTLKLLDPDPDRRYARADDLREDLHRQLTHRPLVFVPDRSVRERVGKWRRRHPRLATGLAVAAAALAFLLLPAGVFLARQWAISARAEQAETAEAVSGYRAAVTDLRAAAVRLASRADLDEREPGLVLGRQVLDRYTAGEGGWQDAPGFARLTPDQQAVLKAALGEVLVLMTRAEGRKDDPESLAAADRWNRLADEVFPADDRPAVVARHRAELDARRAGRPVPPFPAPDPAAARDPDLYFDGLDLAAADRYADALPLLARYCDRNPDRFQAWFALGVCHDALGQPADAAAAFAVCAALRPDVPLAHAHRGLARIGLDRFAEAERDFTRALELMPDWPVVLRHRGLARERQGKLRDAQADFEAAGER
jgi:serine/threonine protein kinase